MVKAVFLLKLQAVRIIQMFHAYLENGLFFMKKFADIFCKVHLFVNQDIDRHKQSFGGALKVLAKCLKNAFDEGYFIRTLPSQISIKN